MQTNGFEDLKIRALGLWQALGRETPVPGLVVSSATAPSGPFHGVYQPSLCVVLQGAKVSYLGAHPYRYDAGKCLIASLDVPIRAEITDASPDIPYVAIALGIEPSVVAELLLEQDCGEPPTSAALGVHPLPDELHDPLRRLLALPERPGDIPVLAPMIRREIVWRLLSGPQGTALRQIGLADSRMGRIGRATAWIRDHFTEPLSVPHLAALAAMSPATFHRHFRTATGMTPVQYRKRLRLQEARRLLLDGADVARTGYTIGYESASQFSREYRRLFGAPPGRDIAAIRASA
ncbi:AraC family transcriptional regulator N-terminal domain-containing protein [Tropicimonas sp.]|uniref:AraC family transcriptional regulator n=1 Tax=Tropicimonas sp. TaxID=2067044 RepID=UPI003A8B652D